MESVTVNHFRNRIKTYTKKRKLLTLPDEFKGTSLLEIGCGARLTYEFNHYNIGLDLVPELLSSLNKLNKKYMLIRGDALNLPIRNNTVDIIIMNMLCHHLIGKNKYDSNKNIKIAFLEMKRILTITGSGIIIEHIAINRFISWIMFIITYLCSKMNLEIPFFSIYKRVITNFQTENSIKDICDSLNLFICEISHVPWYMIRKGFKIRLGKTSTYKISQRRACDKLRVLLQ